MLHWEMRERLTYFIRNKMPITTILILLSVSYFFSVLFTKLMLHDPVIKSLTTLFPSSDKSLETANKRREFMKTYMSFSFALMLLIVSIIGLPFLLLEYIYSKAIQLIFKSSWEKQRSHIVNYWLLPELTSMLEKKSKEIKEDSNNS